MFSNLSSIETEGIRVDVQTAWIKDQSNPGLDHYVFAYKVRITNESPFEVQLISRKWLITDGLGQKREVLGEGVIGQQPILSPGRQHEYISGCSFETPVGKMKGYYYMVRTDGNSLRVRIPEFTLVVPHLLN